MASAAAGPVARACLPSVSAVVPIYNEAELCEQAVRALHDFLRANLERFEIVLIESGSSDGSDAVCDGLQADLSDVRVIHEGRRNGMGAALRLGYAHARMDVVWLVTVDLPFPLETLVDALPLMSVHDCVLSYRTNDPRRLLRRIQSWCYARLVKVLLHLPMRSVNSAFKLFRREFVQSLTLVSNGWFLDAELLYWVARKRLKYLEIPVPLLERAAGRSKVSLLDSIRTLRELVAFRNTVLPRNQTRGPNA